MWIVAAVFGTGLYSVPHCYDELSHFLEKILYEDIKGNCGNLFCIFGGIAVSWIEMLNWMDIIALAC